MIKCAIIDDEQPAINVLVNYIKRIDQLELIGTATNPLRGVDMINKGGIDVVFLDIQMDEMTGIEVMNMLNSSIQVIFCTAFSEFAVESYELNALDYLVKPISFDRFMKAIRKIKNFSDKRERKETEDIPGDYIFVKTEAKGKMLKVDLDDIDYVEAKNNYVAIHSNKRSILVYSTMRDIETALSSSNFIRIHKSFIVPISKISLVEKNFIMINNRKEQIPISKTYKTEFINLVKHKLLCDR